jgi:uncharacterized protein
MLVFSMVVGNLFFSKINSIVYTITSMWLALLLLLFLASIISWILWFIISGFGFVNSKECIIVITLGIAHLFFAWGIYNSFSPNIVTYEIKNEVLKDKWSDKKIILLSDLHLGLVRRENFTKQIKEMINKESPDIVFIAGDLLDGPIIPYEKSLAPLGEITSTYGTYYTAGNHDEYNREQGKYYEVLNKYVKVLNDKSEMINETNITGLTYMRETTDETKIRLNSSGYNENMPSIVIMHDPKNTQALFDKRVNLSLSGHTHGGQFFPITLIVKGIYGKFTQGVNYFEESSSFTTVGIGTAGPAVRIGTRPEIAIIKIK